ncbi:hypothetical protein A0H81_02837 [Grifola frondosa]|uniref:Uncharacterized protein n=1 Tax=Grifola frondosa TaxID=5627 RepID=A0A1C7MLX3_GRIFR|nr:hypothetical protein A0H81_02837 [Grifola frondosa]
MTEACQLQKELKKARLAEGWELESVDRALQDQLTYWMQQAIVKAGKAPAKAGSLGKTAISTSMPAGQAETSTSMPMLSAMAILLGMMETNVEWMLISAPPSPRSDRLGAAHEVHSQAMSAFIDHPPMVIVIDECGEAHCGAVVALQPWDQIDMDATQVSSDSSGNELGSPVIECARLIQCPQTEALKAVIESVQALRMVGEGGWGTPPPHTGTHGQRVTGDREDDHLWPPYPTRSANATPHTPRTPWASTTGEPSGTTPRRS